MATFLLLFFFNLVNSSLKIMTVKISPANTDFLENIYKLWQSVQFSSVTQSWLSCHESTLRMRWPKYWSFSFSIIPYKEIPGLISFRIDWLGLLAVQGTLKSLLQHHSSKAWILWRSAFFTVQLSHPYMTTGKTIALTRQTLVSKVMSLLLNILSRLVITFLPRSSTWYFFLIEHFNFLPTFQTSISWFPLIFKVYDHTVCTHFLHCFLPHCSVATAPLL